MTSSSPLAPSHAFLDGSPVRSRRHELIQGRSGPRLPTSSSESALAVKARRKRSCRDALQIAQDPIDDPASPPSQPRKIKPFILRSTTASPPPSSAEPRPRLGSLDASTIEVVRSSKKGKTRAPGRPYFVPDPLPFDGASRPSKPRSISSSSGSSKTISQAVAKLKMLDPERESTLSHPKRSATWTRDFSSSEEPANPDARRFGDLSNDQNQGISTSSPRRKSPVATVSSSIVKVVPSPNRPPRSPTKIRKPSSDRDLTSTPARHASMSSLRGPGSKSVQQTTSAAEKKKRYATVSRSQSRDKKPARLRSEELLDGIGGEPTEYRSMQEMLEASGFKDTRVITPVSTVRIVDLPVSSLGMPIPGPFSGAQSHGTGQARSPTLVDDPGSSSFYGSPSSLYPPLSKGHKASMLSLRGLFSLWRAEEETNSTQAPQPAEESTEIIVEADEMSDEANSDDTITLRDQKAQFLAKTQAWVDEVAREAATLSISPAMLRASLEPKSFVSMIAAEGSLVSASPLIDESSRAPSMPNPTASQTTPRKGPASASLHGRTSTNSSLLRHAISNPQFASHRLPSPGHYQSFLIDGFGIGYGNLSPTTSRWLNPDKRPSVLGDEEDQACMGDKLPPMQYDDVVSEAGSDQERTPRPTVKQGPKRAIAQIWVPHVPFAEPTPMLSTYWPRLNALRARASEAFLSYAFAHPPPAPTKPTGGPAAEEAKRLGAPKIIRKAVSSTALKPVLTKTMQSGFDEGFDWDAARKRIQGITGGV